MIVLLRVYPRADGTLLVEGGGPAQVLTPGSTLTFDPSDCRCVFAVEVLKPPEIAVGQLPTEGSFEVELDVDAPAYVDDDGGLRRIGPILP